MLNAELNTDQNIDVKLGEKRLRFKMSVQKEVMEQLGCFDTPQYKNARTEEEKMYAENDIFMNWVSSGQTNLFRECFEEIVPPGTDRPEEDVANVVTAVLAEMRMRGRH